MVVGPWYRTANFAPFKNVYFALCVQKNKSAVFTLLHGATRATFHKKTSQIPVMQCFHSEINVLHFANDPWYRTANFAH